METKPSSLYTVRFSDCDPMAHLNNSRYIDYFLNAREDHLRTHYGIDLKEWALQGLGFVVSRHEIQYIRSVTYNDIVLIRTALIGITENTLQVEMCMFDKSGENMKCILLTTFTRIALKTGKKASHSAEFLEQWEKLLVTPYQPPPGRPAAA